MGKENKKSLGAATPRESHYTVQEIEDLLGSVRVENVRIDTAIRIREAESALNKARLKSNHIKLGRCKTVLQSFYFSLRGHKLRKSFNQCKGNTRKWVSAIIHRLTD